MHKATINSNCTKSDYTTLESHTYIYGPHFNTTLEVSVKRSILKFLSDETGATAIEYGLIAAGIALAIIAAVNGLGTTLNGTFATVNSSLK
jgi:pilus assembly protein Flp/PilA